MARSLLMSSPRVSSIHHAETAGGNFTLKYGAISGMNLVSSIRTKETFVSIPEATFCGRGRRTSQFSIAHFPITATPLPVNTMFCPAW